MKKNIDSHIPYVTGKEIYYLKKALKKKKPIKFNIPYVSSKSSYYISKVLGSKNTAGNGVFTKKCQNFLKRNF